MMNELAENFDGKLVVLGFPCNQFGHQENAKGQEILDTLKHVRPGNGFEPKFPIFEKVDVNGANSHPLFVFLRERLPTPSDDAMSFMSNAKNIIWEPVTRSDIAWNFEKFLIAPDGKPYKRYSRYYITSNIKHDIKELITKYKVAESQSVRM